MHMYDVCTEFSPIFSIFKLFISIYGQNSVKNTDKSVHLEAPLHVHVY